MEGNNSKSGKIGVFFQKALGRARTVINDPDKLHKLLQTAKEKVLKLRSENKEFDELMMKLGVAIRMIRAYKNKSYTQVPWKSILTLTAGVIYFVMPLDFVPDFIPIMGFIDDASIMLWIFSSLKKDIAAFEAWEKTMEVKG